MTSLGGLQAVTEATYSSILTVEFLLETFDEDLVVTFIQSLDPRRKKRVVESIFQTVDAFGFVPSSELHYNFRYAEFYIFTIEARLVIILLS